MSNGNGEKKGRPFLTFLFGLAFGIAGALLLPRYLPEGPWTGSSVQGTVLDKERQSDRLLMRISTEEGLMLATFSQKQDDIDLLVQAGDEVRLRVKSFEPFVTDPAIEHVRRPEPRAEGATATEQTKKSYVERMEGQLAEWDAEIGRLRQRAAEASDDARARSQQLVGKLEAESRAARQRLAELKKTTGSSWQELRGGVERAWAELEGDLEEAGREIEAPAEKQPAEEQPQTEPPGDQPQEAEPE